MSGPGAQNPGQYSVMPPMASYPAGPGGMYTSGPYPSPGMSMPLPVGRPTARGYMPHMPGGDARSDGSRGGYGGPYAGGSAAGVSPAMMGRHMPVPGGPMMGMPRGMVAPRPGYEPQALPSGMGAIPVGPRIDQRMTMPAEAVTALLNRNAEILKEYNRVVAGVVRSNTDATPEVTLQLNKMAQELSQSIRLLAHMADNNSRFSKISKVDLRSVFRVDDPMPEPLRAVVWPEHYVASKNAAAAASGGGGAPPLQPAHDAHIPTATFGAAIGGVADVSSASAPIKPEPGVGVGASTRAQLPPPTLIPAAGAAQSDEEMAGTHALPPPPTTHAHTGTHYTAPLDPVAHIPGGMPMVISQATEDAVLSGVGEDSVDASSVAHVPSPSLGMEALAARGIDIPVVVTEPSVSIRDTE